jgi:flagellar hook-associated protein 2
MSLGENSFTAEDVNLSVSVSDTASQKAGMFAFAYNSVTSTATLDGNTLTASVSGTTTTFTSSAPGFETLSIKVETANIPSSTSVSIGVSAKDTFSQLISELLSSTGTIKNKEKDYNDSLADYSDDLSNLTVREESIRSRYVAQFTEMERTVTSLKSTGEYITAILDAWNDQNK